MYRRLLLIALLLSLGACARLQASWRKAVNQISTSSETKAANASVKQLRAPADWGELARDAAHLVAQRASQVTEINNRAIYVAEPKAATPFALALRQWLQSDLLQMGLSVAQKYEAGMLTFDYDVQSVNPASGFQVVVTTSLGSSNRYLFRNTNVYLVNQADVKLYDASMLPPPPPPPATPTPTKTIGVTGKM